MKPFKFFFHYNKIASKKAGKPMISLHFKKKCHIVPVLICDIKTRSKINKRQPYFVMEGIANEIIVAKYGAYVW